MVDLNANRQTAADALLGFSKYFHRGEISPDHRALHKVGGRSADDFYRDRWAYDKVVRSTHGVNCTGSCSWKIYVKDGIITWEAQQTDYPSIGAGQARVRAARLPARRVVLLVHLFAGAGALPVCARRRCWSCTARPRQRLKDPVLAWADVVDDPEKSRRYKAARGMGGFVRAEWWEADRDRRGRARAHDQTYGPDRVAGFSPIPAMSMVSHAVGARFISLIGGAMLSFYDWYADLPVASPQVFGDQTDVPESADWFDAGYLIMWGSNVPVTRTPGRALHDRGPLPRSERWSSSRRTTATTRSSPTSGCRRGQAPTPRWRCRWVM